MFKFKEMFDRLMVAITFAEANEHELALDIMHDRPERKSLEWLQVKPQNIEESRPQIRI